MTQIESSQLLRQSLAAIEKLEREVARLRAGRKLSEPLAIVGIGCEFPAASGAEEFWQLLASGQDSITAIPKDRWPTSENAGERGRSGGFIGHLREFDADFFGIAAKEANALDPQQRLLLEVTWRAIEDAGLDANALHDSRTGVFVGVSSNEYQQLQFAAGRVDPYLLSGTSHATAAGRLSYWLGLKGPSIAIDTACSSSLVALHLAATALATGDCDLAFVGGVNRLISQRFQENFVCTRMLSAEGRCSTFDARADGFVRSEGGAVLALKRLSDVSPRDRVWAVIAGTAINQDGRSAGLTVPNGPSQQAVIIEALARAGVSREAVDYVEAHGTGTDLGDPIELESLAAVFGESHATRPLVVGSVKTNFGHAEAAAGLAGVIKVALSLRHRQIPAHLHLQRPTTQVDWQRMPIRIPGALESWQPRGTRRVAGISAFGFSGTNAHAILTESVGMPGTVAGDARREPALLVVSAKSRQALETLRAQYSQRLGTLDADALMSLCAGAALRRTALPWRIAVHGTDRASLLRALDAAKPAADPADPSPRLGFICGGGDVAIQLAHVRRWSLHGVRPAAVIAGDTRGAAVAACIAGVLDEDQANAVQSAAPRIFSDAGQLSAWIAELHGSPVSLPILTPAAAIADRNLCAFLQLSADAAADFAGREVFASTAVLDDPAALAACLARLFTIGVAVRWERYFAGVTPTAELPNHPFDRRRHWFEEQRDTERANVHHALVWRTAPTADLPHAMFETRVPAQIVFGAQDEAALTEYLRYESRVDEAAFDAIARLWKRCGLAAADGQSYDGDEICTRLSAQPKYQLLAIRMADLLVERGLLARQAESWRCIRAAGFSAAAMEFSATERARPELRLLQRCIDNLHPVLTGELGALQVIFPSGRLDDVGEIYRAGPELHAVNVAAARTVERLVRSLPAGCSARILEVGAGTGATTRQMLRALPLERCEYWFTDVSAAFVDNARRELAEHGSLKFAVLDIDASGDESSIPRADVIVASNVVHATRRVVDTLRRLHARLKPGGRLVLVEGTTAHAWGDLTFGLTDGWWSYRGDPARPSYPLLDARSWHAVLAEAGFAEVLEAAPAAGASQRVYLATRGEARQEAQALVLATRDHTAGTRAVEAAAALGDRAQLVVLDGPGACQRAVDTARESGARRLIYLLNGVEGGNDVARDACSDLVELLRLMQADQQVRHAELQLLTLNESAALAPVAESALALLRISGVERGPPGTRRVVAPPDMAGMQCALLELQAQSVDRETWWSARGRAVPRIEAARVAHAPVELEPAATYLLTGGLGGAGLVVAQWMAARGARSLVLIGRRGVSTAGQRQALENLQQRGIDVRVFAVDVSNLHALQSVVSTQLPGPIRGVVHMAGTVGEQRTYREIDRAALDEVFAAKAIGAENLETALRGIPLDFFVSFSSGAAAWGFKGQAHYAAASAYVQGLMARRRERGEHGVAISWGHLSCGGMTVSPESQQMLAAYGVYPISEDEILAAVSDAMRNACAHPVVARNDWGRLHDLFAAGGEGARFGPLLAAPVHEAPVAPARAQAVDRLEAPAITLEVKLARIPQRKRQSAMEEILLLEVAGVLGETDVGRLSAERGFQAMGVDSLMALDLRNRIGRRAQRELPATMIYDFPNVRTLATHLLTTATCNGLAEVRAVSSEGNGIALTRDAADRAARGVAQ